MSHLRKQIRDAVVTRLIAGIPSVDGRVFPSRVLPVASVPSMMVFTDDEQCEIASVGYPSLLQRQLDVVIIVRVKKINGCDDDLDQLQLDIEKVLSNTVQDYTLGGLVQRILLRSARQEFDSMSDQNVAELHLLFKADYRTQVNTPDTPI